MSRLRGDSLVDAWPAPTAGRDRVADEVGGMLAALHALDPTPLDGAVGPPDWSEFLAEQCRSAAHRQRGLGVADVWLEQIPGFLATAPPCGARRVLLHTEVMREHLLADPAGPGLTGLFDVEPAMLGDPAYDFVAVGLFVSRGDPRVLGRIMAAYGRRFAPRELLASMLLHVYPSLPRYLRELPAPPEATLDSLAETWFGAA